MTIARKIFTYSTLKIKTNACFWLRDTSGSDRDRLDCFTPTGNILGCGEAMGKSTTGRTLGV